MYVTLPKNNMLYMYRVPQIIRLVDMIFARGSNKAVLRMHDGRWRTLALILKGSIIVTVLLSSIVSDTLFAVISQTNI